MPSSEFTVHDFFHTKEDKTSGKISNISIGIATEAIQAVNHLQKAPPGWLSGERVGLMTWWL